MTYHYVFVTALEQSTAVCGVVSVHTGSGAWGTGILVKDDIIITCAHVIQQEKGICTFLIFYALLYMYLGPFTIRNQAGSHCSVVYCSNQGDVPDIAVLKINNFQGQSTCNIVLPVTPSEEYNIGEAVGIISYGLLRPHDENAGPLITKGAISKIIHHNNTAVMIQVNHNYSTHIYSSR